MSFSLDAPLMKFLVGLELLLKTSQEWEVNAASHVSLHESLTDITKLIIRWRKLELETWPQLLERKKRGKVDER